MVQNGINKGKVIVTLNVIYHFQLLAILKFKLCIQCKTSVLTNLTLMLVRNSACESEERFVES